MKDKFIFLRKETEKLKEEGLYNTARTLENHQGPWVNINGREMLNLCSNNYLGFCTNEEVKTRAKEAIDKFGVGAGAVRPIAGNLSIHEELERKLAEFKNAEAVILLQSGILANIAVIPLVVGERDIVLSDEMNHASIIDGCKLSRSHIVHFKHLDMGDLKEKFEDYKNFPGRKLVVTDGVFSMDGDIAPLPDIVELAERYNALIMVDDAHGEGVLGENGKGILNYYHLEGRVDIDVGTLSKAFGVIGGYVAGSKNLIDYMKQRARPFLYSTPLSPADTASLIAVIDILSKDDTLVKNLWYNANYIKERFNKLGFNTGRSKTPITPVILGGEKLAKEFSLRLFEEGVFVQSIVFPMVKKGSARIRVMVSAAHSQDALDFGIGKFEKIGKEIGVLR